jgi:hypothetical protein
MKAIRTRRTKWTTSLAANMAANRSLTTLAYACLRCNAWKGSDVGSVDPETGAFASLFHPRRQRWEVHFVLRGAVIEPLTPEGKATARLLKLNLDKRVVERQLLATVGRYPR